MERPETKSLSLGGESSSSLRRDYEVFLSFRGPDTRFTITDSLYATMIRAGICVFKDDEELRVGEEIKGELLGAISNSKIYIPIFSKDYASSKWCLRELTYMVECWKRDEKVILPIFYGVDVSDLKLKTGLYGKALRKHRRRSDEDTAKQWEGALRAVTRIKGWNLRDHGQDKLMALVLEEVLNKLRSTEGNWCDGLVGIDNQMEAVMELLGLGTSSVRFVVIHGMGGIGKTSLARAIFKRFSSQFQYSIFLSNIRANNILSLQMKLLCGILHIRHLEVIDANEGVDMIKERLRDKKVMLVLDDMDKRDQLMKLAGKSSWFGLGSRIIITTRNTYFLPTKTDAPDDNISDNPYDNIIPLNHRDFSFYEMKEMQFRHALQLFSKHSFESDSPPQNHISISCEIVETTGGLPLAIEVIGSLLHSKSMRTWKDTLNKLKKVPNQDVQKKLLISYEELEYEQRQIFLDIACHCIGEERFHLYYMWKACEFFPKTGLNVLIHLSLIKVIKDRLWMHDQLRDLGREIVRQECFLVPGKRSRLWCPTIALEVVQNNLGTDNIVALKLPRLANGHNFKSDEFSRLPNLRFLELDGGNFVGDFKNLLSKLTWLSWRHCPSNLHTTGLCLRNLAVLKLLESDITEDWNGWGACMVNDNLKVIYLASCNYLKSTPDFSKCLKLKKLVLKDCTRLEEINSSINQLGHLKYLDINGQNHLLQRQKFLTIPLSLDLIGGLKSLSVLKVEYHCGIGKLPHSMGELLGLKHLSLYECRNLRELPNSLGELRSLLFLDLGFTGISALPDSIGRLSKLKTLELSWTKISRLPMTINQLFNLKQLDLSDCRRLQLLPNLPISLKYLDITSSSLQVVPNLSNLTNLDYLTISDCNYSASIIERGRILHPNLEWLGRLHKLKALSVVFSDSRMHPTDLSTLSRLQCLIITCADLRSLTGLPSSLEQLALRDVKTSIEWSSFSNLGNLSKLWLFDCPLREIEFDNVLGQLKNLRHLDVGECKSLVRISSVSSLKEHQTLMVEHCPQLIEIECQPPSTEDCNSTERPIPDTSKLENLGWLMVKDCESLQKIPKALRTNVSKCPRLDGSWDPWPESSLLDYRPLLKEKI